MSEGSGVKPLFFCCEIFLYFYHFHTTQSGSLRAWFAYVIFFFFFCPWPIIPSLWRCVHPKCSFCVVIQYVNGHNLVFVSFAGWFERVPSSQNAPVSWLRTHRVRHQVKISACVNVHASVYCRTSSSQRCRRSSLLKILFAFIFVHFKCTPNTPPTPSTPTHLQVQVTLKKGND